MTLQQPTGMRKKFGIKYPRILCHKCGAPIVFSKDYISPSGKKVPLDPHFNNEPHQQHCMYFTAPSKPDLEQLLFHFLSKIPNHKPMRIIGTVGRAF